MLVEEIVAEEMRRQNGECERAYILNACSFLTHEVRQMIATVHPDSHGCGYERYMPVSHGRGDRFTDFVVNLNGEVLMRKLIRDSVERFLKEVLP